MSLTHHETKKITYFLPNTFTALNMACGFGSILLSSQGRINDAAMILILGAIFDSVDGRIARLTGTQSPDFIKRRGITMFICIFFHKIENFFLFLRQHNFKRY
jgi:phosphatidylserine synthase